jgi:hypothetical protein
MSVRLRYNSYPVLKQCSYSINLKIFSFSFNAAW